MLGIDGKTDRTELTKTFPRQIRLIRNTVPDLFQNFVTVDREHS